MNGGNLNGCTGHADARRAVETHADLVGEVLARNAEYRYYSGLMEYVAARDSKSRSRTTAPIPP